MNRSSRIVIGIGVAIGHSSSSVTHGTVQIGRRWCAWWCVIPSRPLLLASIGAVRSSMTGSILMRGRVVHFSRNLICVHRPRAVPVVRVAVCIGTIIAVGVIRVMLMLCFHTRAMTHLIVSLAVDITLRITVLAIRPGSWPTSCWGTHVLLISAG